MFEEHAQTDAAALVAGTPADDPKIQITQMPKEISAFVNSRMLDLANVPKVSRQSRLDFTMCKPMGDSASVEGKKCNLDNFVRRNSHQVLGDKSFLSAMGLGPPRKNLCGFAFRLVTV